MTAVPESRIVVEGRHEVGRQGRDLGLVQPGEQPPLAPARASPIACAICPALLCEQSTASGRPIRRSRSRSKTKSAGTEEGAAAGVGGEAHRPGRRGAERLWRPRARRRAASVQASRHRSIQLHLQPVAPDAQRTVGLAGTWLASRRSACSTKASVGGVDGDAGLDPAGEARGGRQLGEIVEARPAGERAHGGLVDAGLDEGMAHAVLGRGLQAGAVVAEIVEVGARRDRVVGVRGGSCRRDWSCRSSSG